MMDRLLVLIAVLAPFAAAAKTRRSVVPSSYPLTSRFR